MYGGNIYAMPAEEIVAKLREKMTHNQWAAMCALVESFRKLVALDSERKEVHCRHLRTVLAELIIQANPLEAREIAEAIIKTFIRD